MPPFQTRSPQPPTYSEQSFDMTPADRPARRWTRRLAQIATVILYAIAIGSIALQLTI